MKITPLILGAGALGLMAGLAGANAINTDPVVASWEDPLATLPDHQVAARGEQRRTGSPPNHYPMQTPEGVVEVQDLAMYGRYRDSRLGSRYSYRGEEEAAAMDGYAMASAETIDISAAADPRELATRYPQLRNPLDAPEQGSELLVVGEPAAGTAVAPTTPQPETRAVAPSVTTAPNTGARIVNVSAVLATQQSGGAR